MIDTTSPSPLDFHLDSPSDSHSPTAFPPNSPSTDFAAGLTLSGVSKHFPVPSFPWQKSYAGKWALRDITLSVGQGEILGIVGTNGSGKTTLLRLIAGVSQPTSGTIKRSGSVAALLDLSGGFHPNLTGWQNLFLGASLAGLTRQQVRNRMGAIVDFSGLATADLDRPVREWSAGMIARLGFSIAVGVDPAVVVVDEVLAVGDAGFQARCAQRLLQFRDQGKSMVMVSHVTAVLRNVADRLLWIDHGVVRALGPVTEVADAYESSLRRRIADRRHRDTPEISGQEPPARQMAGLEHGHMRTIETAEGWSLILTFEWIWSGAVPIPGDQWLAFSLVTETGVLLDEGWLPVPAPSVQNSRNSLELEFERLALMPGNYEVLLTPSGHTHDGSPPAATGDAFPPQPVGQELVLPFTLSGHRFAADQYPVRLPVDFQFNPVGL